MAPSNTCFLGPPESITQMVSQSVQLFLHRSWHSVAMIYNGLPIPPWNYNIPMGDLDRHLTRFLWPIWAHNPNSISIGSAVFAQITLSLYFTMGCPFPLKIAPSHVVSGPSSNNTWFPGPTQVLSPNSISISSATFAGLNSVTDRQTTLLGR